MWNLLKRIYKLLTRREKILGGIVIILFGITSIMEVAGLGFIFLYVKIIMEPAQLQSSPFLLMLQEWLEPSDQKHFLILLGIGLLAVLLLKTIFGVLSTWLSVRFSMGRFKMFSIDLYRIYVFKNYSYFLENNSTKLKQNVLEEIGTAIFYVILPLLIVISEIMVLGFIILFLLFMHPTETLIMFAVTGGIFGFYAVLVRGWLDRLGQQKQQANLDRHALANDTFMTIKEAIVWNVRLSFLYRFKDAVSRHSHAISWNEVLMKTPRHLIEALGLSMIVGLIIHKVMTSDNPASIIPIVALYGAAGMRMLPSFNRIATNLGTIRFHKRSLMSFYGDLLLRRFLPAIPPQASVLSATLSFQEKITFCDVSFAYSEEGKKVTENFSLTIKKYSSIAFVGASGAGKSTLVEMLLGLVDPISGKICVDDVPLNAENIDAWRQQIGYIPQRVFLLDKTVAENVAFGVSPQEIDMERVREACALARISKLVECDLAQGYKTPLGDHGVRLSGGQAQRIAIARALYRQPSVLIMDEATAALDGITEYEITETLSTLAKKLTIILIAHRLNTVKHCEQIYLLDKGKIIDAGTYSELLERNETFQMMAR